MARVDRDAVCRLCYSSLVSGVAVSFANNQLTGVLPTAVAAVYPATLQMWSGTCITGATTALLGCSLLERPALIDLFVATGTTGLRIGSVCLTQKSRVDVLDCTGQRS